MSSVPGWYPDPAGSPALRWWDGSGWTSTMTAGTASVQTLAKPTMDVIPRQLHHVETFRPYQQPTRKPWYRRRTFIGCVSGVVALVVLLVVAGVGVVVSQNNQAKSIAAHTTIEMPETVAGVARLHTALADAVSARLDQSALGPHLTGVYGGSTEVAAEVNIQQVTTARARIPDTVKGVEKGLRDGLPALVFQRVNAGPLGGQMECAPIVYKGRAVNFCVFADSATVGSITLFGQYTSDSALPLEFRTAMEVRH